MTSATRPHRYTWLVAVAVAAALIAAPDAHANSEPFLIRTDALADNPGAFRSIESVGPNWVLVEAKTEMSQSQYGLTAAGVANPNTTYHLASDPLFGGQWEHENTGQTGGTPDADVDAPDARSISSGEPSQVVAIIDGGVVLDHADLADRIWVNTEEIPGNGLDDDSNGFVDDVSGWDFTGSGIGDADPTDTYGHGTAVASVIAASVNDVGMEGIAPGATVMPLRVCVSTSCSLSDITSAVHYAIDNGASVINLSLGISQSTPDAPLAEAIEAAGAADIVVVAAAGNFAQDNDDPSDGAPFYPASLDLDNVIAVAATDHDDALATFSSGGSNWGLTSVDLAAPGKAVTVANLYSWTTASGTSFAAPMVAGTASIIRALKPTWAAAEVKEVILGAVDPITGLEGLLLTGGRLNTGSAVVASSGPLAVATASPSLANHPASFTFDGSASTDNGWIASYRWVLPDGTVAASAVAEWPSTSPGEYTASLTVTDNHGLTDTAQVSVVANGVPTARAHADPLLGTAPLGITLAGNASSDPGGAIEVWEWNTPSGTLFGSVAETSIHSRGVHDITLDVVDRHGATDRDTVRVLVGTDFTDTADSTFRLDVAWMSAWGLTKGCNPPANDLFCPNESVTRGEASAFVARLLSLPPPRHDHFRDDVDSRFESDINRLADAGILRGCNPPTNDEVCPEDPLTRGQIAAILVRSLSLPASMSDVFTDDDGHVFEGDIDRLASAGLTRGCNPPMNTWFCPDRHVTRGEIAALLHRTGAEPNG